MDIDIIFFLSIADNRWSAAWEKGEWWYNIVSPSDHVRFFKMNIKVYTFQIIMV